MAEKLYKANAVVLKTSQATGVSMSWVLRIAKRKDEPLMTPGKNILRESLDLGS